MSSPHLFCAATASTAAAYGGGAPYLAGKAQQPESREWVRLDFEACSARRFSSPYVETISPQPAHRTGSSSFSTSG
jgi:hypothetical protein